MATKITKTSYTHALRIPTELYKWVMAQKLNPSETFSAVILRLLWDRKNADSPARKTK